MEVASRGLTLVRAGAQELEQLPVGQHQRSWSGGGAVVHPDAGLESECECGSDPQVLQGQERPPEGEAPLRPLEAASSCWP